MITLEQWRALVSVVDCGGYARAAEKLNKTQSSVTYAVKKLESLLGVKAFEISGRKARLTPVGELLLRRARGLLDEAAAIERSARRLSAGWEAEIGLAAEIVFPRWLLFRALERFGAESPHTRIEVLETVLGGTQEALVRREVDLAVSGLVPAGFVGDALLRLRFVLVARADHALLRLGRELTLQDLRAQRQLVVRESGTRRATPTWIEAAQRWTVSHMATSLEAVRAGYGYAWFPQEMIRAELASGTLKALPLREGGERYAQLYLVYADRDGAGPGVLRLADILRETVRAECVSRGEASG
ncbi:MAG TPA: LysR family transcriptional regulator [Burkholderiales bacterium]|nr:LysR family transcriptional regulator [Burkholderiales bacterium]